MQRCATTWLVAAVTLLVAAPASAAEPALPDQVQALLRLVDEGHAKQWSNACDTLAIIGPTARPAVKPLLAIAADTRRDPYRRAYALRPACVLAPDDSAVYRTLIDLIGDSHQDVRDEAADYLGRLYSHRPDVAKLAVPALMASWQKHRRDSLFIHKALYDFGPLAAPATDDLIAMLTPPRDPDPKLPEHERDAVQQSQSRSMPAKILGRIGTPAKFAIPAIADLLRSKEKWERRGAAEALADFGSLARDAVPALVTAAKDEVELEIRYRAMYALGRIGHADTAGLPGFKDQAAPHMAMLRFGYIVGKATAGPRPVPQLLEAIRSREMLVRTHALDEAEKLGRAALPDLLAAFQHKDSKIRWAAISVVGKLGGRIYNTGVGAAFWASQEGIAAQTALISLLAHPEHDTRAAAALNLMPTRSGKALAALSKLAQSPHWYDRSLALTAMREYGPTVLAPQAVAALVAGLRDPNLNVRAAAAATLSALGPAAKDVVPQLIEAINDDGASTPSDWPPPPPDATPEDLQQYEQMKQNGGIFVHPAVSTFAMRAIAAIGPSARAALPTLIDRLDGIEIGLIRVPDFERRRNEIDALAGIGPDAADAIPLLLRRLHTEDKWNASDAIGCMGERGAAALAPLLRTYDQTAGNFNYEAFRVLAQMGRPAAAVIRPLLNDPDARIRRDAAEILNKMGLRATTKSG